MTDTSYNSKLEQVEARLGSLERKPSEEQLDFILHPLTQPCYLKACPGSGKTEVVGLKAAYEIAAWEDNFSGMAILSFTKNAAKEIADRVKKYGGSKAIQHPHFIGTIDSWLHGYVLHPFGHKAVNYKGKTPDKSFRLVDNEERYDFLKQFETVISNTPYKSVGVNEYYFECTDPVSLQTQSRKLDISTLSPKLVEELQLNKSKFLKAGFTTYADAEFLCFYLLGRNETILQNLVKRFPVIVIDECQDLSNNQLEILRLLNKKGATIHFVGDNNQSIYEFKKVYVEKINSYITDYKLNEKLLTLNFRSNQNIVNIALALEKYNTGITPIPVQGNEAERFNKNCLLWKYKVTDSSQLPQKFIDYISLINSNIQQQELKIDLSKSAILARGHSTLSVFRSQPLSDLGKIELFANALSCWANNPRSVKDMQNALQQLGKSISMLAYNGHGNHAHQYCPEPYNLIEWRHQLFDLIENSIHSRINLYPLTSLTWTQWVANLKLFLENYWNNFRTPVHDWNSAKTKIIAPKGKASHQVTDTINSIQNTYSNKIRMTTFHDVKGETLDAVLVVSSRNESSKGGHFKHWLTNDPNKKEYVRFAYVASSRPKHLLIWAIPDTAKSEDIKKVLALGFVENTGE